MDRLSSAGMLVARILLSSLFLHAGIRKVFTFSATQEYMSRHGMKMTGLFALLAIFVEVAGGLSVLVGWYPRLGAAALFLFLIPATAVFHRDFESYAQVVQFSKNVAIMGGLLAVVAAGAGEFTVRRKGGTP